MSVEWPKWALDDDSLRTEFNQLLAGLSLQNRKALFDLVGGFIHLSWSSDQYDELLRTSPESLTEDQLELMEALNHERLHFIQTCTFGFMYLLAIDLFSSAVALLAPSTNRTFQRGEDLPADARRLLAAVDQRLAGRSDDGISSLDIIESLTHFHQISIRLHLTPESYRELLSEVGGSVRRDPFLRILDSVQAGSEYTAAYEAAVRHSGPEAFFVFPKAAALALCTRRPEQAFRPLCQHVLALRRGESNGIPLSEFGWMGEAFELARRNDELGRTHPIYSDAIQRQGPEALRELLRANVQEVSERLQRLPVPMLCYENPAPRPFLRAHQEFWPDLDEDERKLRVQSCAIFSALAVRALASVQP